MKFSAALTEECGGEEVIEIEADDADAAAEIARERLEEWVRGGEYGDLGAIVSARWSLADDDGDEADDGWIAVEIEPRHDALIAEAGGDTSCDHDWTSEGEGGCDDNPGVWSDGGTAFTFASHCRKCGLRRVEHTLGSQRSPGEHDTVEYSMPDSWCGDCERVACECDRERD